MMMTVGMFAKEYTWGTTTRCNNNYPEVVKTMPGVQAALKELRAIYNKEISFITKIFALS